MFNKSVLTALIAPLAMLLVTTVASVCHAGSFYVQDDARVFSSSETDALREATRGLDFEVRIFTTNAHERREDFVRYVLAQVDVASMLVIGIAPRRHWISVGIGNDLRLEQSVGESVAHSVGVNVGRDAWLDAIKQVIARVDKLQQSGPRGVRPERPPYRCGADLLGSYCGILMLVIGLFTALGAYFGRQGPACTHAKVQVQRDNRLVNVRDLYERLRASCCDAKHLVKRYLANGGHCTNTKLS